MKRLAARVQCPEFFVDMRLMQHEGRWLAVADTPDGPSVGWGPHWFNAAIMALEPFDGRVEELLRSISWQGRPVRDRG
jgi:hypothetical protein